MQVVEFSSYCRHHKGPSINYVVSKLAIFDPLHRLSSFLLSEVYVVNRLLRWLWRKVKCQNKKNQENIGCHNLKTSLSRKIRIATIEFLRQNLAQALCTGVKSKSMSEQKSRENIGCHNFRAKCPWFLIRKAIWYVLNCRIYEYNVIFIYFQAAVFALFWLSQFCTLKKIRNRLREYSKIPQFDTYQIVFLMRNQGHKVIMQVQTGLEYSAG
jgi:hypothetical protein